MFGLMRIKTHLVKTKILMEKCNQLENRLICLKLDYALIQLEVYRQKYKECMESHQIAENMKAYWVEKNSGAE